MRNYYFEKLIRQAVAALPSAAKGAMNNVAFAIEDEARRKRAGETSIKKGEVSLVYKAHFLQE